MAGQDLEQDGITTLNFTGGSFATATSGLGNSADVTWEQDQAEDGSLGFRHGSTMHSSSLPQGAKHGHYFHKVENNGEENIDFYSPYGYMGHRLKATSDVIKLYSDKLAAASCEDSTEEYEA